MQIKIDKDKLIKHRFWVALAFTVPLVLAAVFILVTAVGADIEKAKKDVKDWAKKIAQPGTIVGPKMIEQHEEVAKERKAKETVVHRDAFDLQGAIATFPEEFERKFDFQNGWFALEVKILPEQKGDEKDWPADQDDPNVAEKLVHGVVKSSNEIYAVLVGRDKKEITIRPTSENVLKVNRQEVKEGEKSLGWKDIRPGAFLAVSYYKARYFYDPFTSDERFEFNREYKSQIHPILSMLDPLTADGRGVVQLGSWPYNPDPKVMPPEKSKFFTFVANEWKTDIANFHEEAWLAQEDLWIQRELFRIIREANDSIGRCKVGDDPQTGKPVYVNPTAEDRAKPAVFYNPYYEVKLEWSGDSKLVVTVKNMLDRRQKVDVRFRVKLSKSPNVQLASQEIKIDDEPLNPRGDAKDSCKKEFAVEKAGVARTGIYEVEQVLTWETAAVKRIELVTIGLASGEIAHSHRTFSDGSKPFREEKKEEKKEEAATGGVPGGQPGGVGGPRGGGGFGSFKPGGGQDGGGGEGKVGVNGVHLDRYLEVSDQSRRVPVGLSLIVDQDHVNRVLTAFNNSKLRFLSTQVLLNRFAGSLRPAPVVGAASGTPGGAAPGPMANSAPMGEQQPAPMSAAGGGGPRGGGSSSGPPGGFKPGATGGIGIPGGGLGAAANPAGNAAVNTGSTEELENNVELVLYGIVTLYERYPKRKPAGDAK